LAKIALTNAAPIARSTPSEDFAPVGLVTDVPMLLVARANFPAKDLKELVAHVRTQGDKVTYGNVGLGSAVASVRADVQECDRSQAYADLLQGGGPH
jgi:tripartite-type tricarboxylate transporter receptor subunit TctC